jgi:hypothetical protein
MAAADHPARRVRFRRVAEDHGYRVGTDGSVWSRIEFRRGNAEVVNVMGVHDPQEGVRSVGSQGEVICYPCSPFLNSRSPSRGSSKGLVPKIGRHVIRSDKGREENTRANRNTHAVRLRTGTRTQFVCTTPDGPVPPGRPAPAVVAAVRPRRPTRRRSSAIGRSSPVPPTPASPRPDWRRRVRRYRTRLPGQVLSNVTAVQRRSRPGPRRPTGPDASRATGRSRRPFRPDRPPGPRPAPDRRRGVGRPARAPVDAPHTRAPPAPPASTPGAGFRRTSSGFAASGIGRIPAVLTSRRATPIVGPGTGGSPPVAASRCTVRPSSGRLGNCVHADGPLPPP